MKSAFSRLMLLLLAVTALTVPSRTAHAQDEPTEGINRALEDLSARIGTPLVLENLDTWFWDFATYPDTGLGCPQSAPSVQPEETAGYSISLIYQGVTYDYRYSLGGTIFFLCSGTPVSEPPTSAPPPNGCPVQPSLRVGEQGRVIRDEEGEPNPLRAAPSRESEQIGQIPPDATFTVLEGPNCENGNFVYWRVNYNGLEGWTAEANADGDYFLERIRPAATPDFSACVIQPRLTAGGAARVVVDANSTPNILRSDVGTDSSVLREIPAGEVVFVVEGPVCSPDFVWWRVTYDGITGWTTEGSASLGYFLEPADLSQLPPGAIPPTATPNFSGCPVVPRLVVGQRGRLLDEGGSANNIRAQADPNAEQVGQIPPGAVFNVLAGPVCTEDFTYWQVEYEGVTGWTAEGSGENYFAVPLLSVTFEGGSFDLDGSVSTDYEVAFVAGNPEPDTAPNSDFMDFVPVEHLQIALNTSAQQPGIIRIFRAADYEAAFPGAITALTAQLQTRAEDNPIGDLHRLDATPEITSAQTYVDGESVSGWRAIVVYRAPEMPLLSANLMYVGFFLSNDGQYFMQAVFPLSLDDPTGEIANSAEEEEALIENIVAQLEAGNVNLFTPRIEALDTTLASFQLQWATATPTPAPVACGSFVTRLSIGQPARVTPGLPNNVRQNPESGAALVGEIPGGESFSVISGPVCDGDSAWWEVDYNGLRGWTLEGSEGEYWTEPAN